MEVEVKVEDVDQDGDQVTRTMDTLISTIQRTSKHHNFWYSAGYHLRLYWFQKNSIWKEGTSLKYDERYPRIHHGRHKRIIKWRHEIIHEINYPECQNHHRCIYSFTSFRQYTYYSNSQLSTGTNHVTHLQPTSRVEELNNLIDEMDIVKTPNKWKTPTPPSDTDKPTEDLHDLVI